MEKLPKVPSESSSPIKSARKGDQKVQFSDEADLRLHGQKVSGKPPEVPRAPPYSRSSSRLSGSSSISSSSSSSSHSKFSSGGGSSSTLDRSYGKGSESSKWTTSLDRKRSGSVRSKTTDRSQRGDINRSLSLDRRRAEKSQSEGGSPSHSSTERKRRECENRDTQSREKKPKTRIPGMAHSRSYSGERPKLPARPKLPPPTLNRTDNTDNKSTIHTEEKKPTSRFHMDWAERMKRAASRSPCRKQVNGDTTAREDKENEKARDKARGDTKTQDNKKERGRPLKRENRSNKLTTNGKHK